MAKKGKTNQVQVKLYVPETGEFKVRMFNRQKIDIANYTQNGYSKELRKTVKFIAKKFK